MSPLALCCGKWMKMDEEIPHLLCTDDLPVEKGRVGISCHLSRNQL
jgi:hypothetical protein